tara:strand:- start:5518 stop:6861 length:1344 start_codon:yes stop_codon:yes gene_type:complete
MQKKTLLLFAAFLLLGSFVYFVEIKGGEEKEKKEELAASLFKVKQQNIESVTLLRNGYDTLTFTNKDNNWQITQPVETEGEATPITASLSAFADATIKRRITSLPEKLVEFGLNPPKAEVIIYTKYLEDRHVLIGNETPTRGDVFAAYKDSSTVFVVPSNVKTEAEKPLFDLRDKKIAHFETADVNHVKLNSGSGVIELLKSGGNWIMVNPEGVPVDNSRVNSFLNSLKNYSATEFVDEFSTDLGKYGLNEATISISLTLGDEKSTKEIMVGNPAEDEESFYCYESGRNPVFLIRESTKSSMEKEQFYFQDKKLAKFEKETITEIRFSGAYQLTLLKEDTIWYSHGDSSFSVRGSQMKKLFSSLKNLNAKNVVTYEPENESNYGFDVPFLELNLSEGDNPISTVIIGDAAEKDRYIKNNRFPFVYTISVSQIEQITKWLDEQMGSTT